MIFLSIHTLLSLLYLCTVFFFVSLNCVFIMAKVVGFLRGAKGKVGDFVLQKGEKTTVLRANNGVANPQSAAQMTQRVVFGTVTNAAKKLLSVIGLSFYGVSDGKLSRRKFVEMNIPILKASADAQLSGEETTSPRCFFKGKDVNQLVVNPYVVSDGSLVLPEQWEPKPVTGGGQFTIFSDNTIDWSVVKEAQTITGAELLSSMFGCGAGDQITLVSILAKNGDAVPYNYESGENVTVNGVPMPNYDWQRFTRMYAPRIVFKQSDLANMVLVADETAETLTPKLIAAVRGCIDLDKSSSAFVALIEQGINCYVEENRYGFAIDETNLHTLADGSGWAMLAAGVIRSANIDGVWDFSRCQLKTSMELDTAGGPGDNQNYSGLMLGIAVYTYVGVADSSNKNFMTTGTPFDEMPQQA